MTICTCICIFQEKVVKQHSPYKGIHFGKLTSKRMDFGGKDGPGPGEYEPYRENALMNLNVEHANIQASGRQQMDAKLPRYHQLVVQEEEKKVISNITVLCHR